MPTPEVPPQIEYKKVERLYGTRAFEILALSSDPNGIEIVPGELLPRPDLVTTLKKQGEYGESILKKITADISGREVPAATKEAIKDSMESRQEKARLQFLIDNFGFTPEQSEKYKILLPEEKLKDPAMLSGGDISRLAREYEHLQKVGFFDVQMSMDGKRLKANMRKVPFVMYKHIRSEEDERRGLLELANPTGCAVIIETTEPDGKNYFGLGRRGQENGSYRASRSTGGQPGAWAAGIMDLNFSRYTAPGLPESFTNAKVVREIDKELHEETGMSTKTIGGSLQADLKDYAVKKMQAETGATGADIEALKVTSFGKDLIARHNEIGLLAKSRWSKDRLVDIHKNMKRSNSEFNFAEEVFFIPATKESVAKFITQCKTPMPPTHYMPLMAAMYEKIIVTGNNTPEARKEADKWMKEVEAGLDQNWKEIDEMVAKFYEDNPEAIKENKAESKRENINTKGFEPLVLADKQGLPTLNSELERLKFPQVA